MRLLIIGTDTPQTARIAASFTERAWQVTTRPAVLPAADDRRHDVVILAESGAADHLAALIASLRDGAAPLLLVLGDGGRDERQRALGLGADEVIPRTIPASLLAARVMALLRLSGDRLREEYRFGDLTVDMRTRRVRRGGHDLILSHREFQLLVLMVQNAGATLLRSAIIERLWPADFSVGHNAVDALASRLRRKIDGLAADKLIHTVRGVGYHLGGGEARSDFAA